MASTIDNSVLLVRISEELELNGRKFGDIVTKKISGINEVSERIITAATAGTTVLSLGSSNGAGAFVRDNVKYIRITNLDNSNFVRLALITDAGGNPAAHIKLPALDSFILSSGVAATVADGDAVTFDNVTSIVARANTADVDLGIFVASQ